MLTVQLPNIVKACAAGRVMGSNPKKDYFYAPRQKAWFIKAKSDSGGIFIEEDGKEQRVCEISNESDFFSGKELLELRGYHFINVEMSSPCESHKELAIAIAKNLESDKQYYDSNRDEYFITQKKSNDGFLIKPNQAAEFMAGYCQKTTVDTPPIQTLITQGYNLECINLT